MLPPKQERPAKIVGLGFLYGVVVSLFSFRENEGYLLFLKLVDDEEAIFCRSGKTGIRLNDYDVTFTHKIQKLIQLRAVHILA